MKIDNELFLLDKGEFSKSDSFQTIINELRSAIRSVTWGSPNKFIINPQKKANGVIPIKTNFISSLQNNGWLAEQRMSLVNNLNPGPIDIIKDTPFGRFAVEWETGNISSSHRALNKITVGIIQQHLIGGILILPKKNLAQYLTDRIGNYEELSPYFVLYQNVNITNGIIGVISIDYDSISQAVDIIPKGKDGNASK